MAIQAQLYMENLGFPFGGGGENLSQDWMENACGFDDLCYFNLQQQQQQKQQQYQQLQQGSIQQQRNQDLCFSTTKNIGNNVNQPMPIISQSIAAQMEKQSQEIDWFISLQNEKLRLALQEQRKNQAATILKKYESKSHLLLRQKDEEIAKARNKTMELEEYLRRSEMEKNAWERMAKEKETMAINLNNTIEQLKEKNNCFLKNSEVEDAESCCQTGENNETRGAKNENKNMICKNCFSANSCFVFLPCRHLCSCKACDGFLDACPVCRMAKKASIEVFI